MDTILKLLEDDATLTPAQLATMLDKEEGDIRQIIRQYEKDGEYVNAIIEVKMTPQRDRGFDRVAEKIYNYPEVKSLYLMSGGYDLCVIIEGKTMKEVAYFVAQKLAPIEFVISTSTHFVLRKYKDKGVIYGAQTPDERGNI